MSIFVIGRYFRDDILRILFSFMQVYIMSFVFLNSENYSKLKPPAVDNNYDFIVVGSGSAGAVVASRLSEVKGWKVLLLEAGNIPNAMVNIPGLNLLLYRTTNDWQYRIAPQKYSMFGYKNRRNHFPRGKTIGGTSSTNYMMYVRGNMKDFDRWAALNNTGWDYKSVLKYFKKSEDFKGRDFGNNVEYHGKGGPLSVETKRYQSATGRAFEESAEELGFNLIDENGPSQIGFSVPNLNTRNGVRDSTAEAFLKPILKQQNFYLLSGAKVLKVLFHPRKNSVVQGVQYIHKGQKIDAFARKEVIICAGAVDSPKLLMLSGIGPSEELNKHNIKTRVKLPGVGKNLQDHPVIFGLTWLVDRGNSLSVFDLINPQTWLDYKTRRTGPLSVPMGVEGNAYSRITEGDPDWPDLQVLVMSISAFVDAGFAVQDIIGFDEQFFLDYFGNILNRPAINMGPTLLQPKSRGTISLRSKNPFDRPIIDPNFFSHPDDLKFFIKAIKFCLKIGDTAAFRRIGARFFKKPVPGCTHLKLESDSYWKCFTQHLASSIYHPAGTCKMAPADDPMGVVDSRLRVRGIRGLRVIDASIMPMVTSGNTHAPTVMIGEKGADLIKEDWHMLPV